MPAWYLLGGLGLAAGLVWLVARGDKSAASGAAKEKLPVDASESTDAETQKAIDALALLPADLLTKAKDALLSGNADLMRKTADTLDAAGHGIEAQVLRGRSLAIRAASAGAMPSERRPTSPGSPREVLERDRRSHWAERFAATRYATENVAPDVRLIEAPSLYDQAGILLDGVYVIDGVTYFVGDPRTMPGSATIDYAAALPNDWSLEGALPNVYLPAEDELRTLQSAVMTSEAATELEAVLAGMGKPSYIEVPGVAQLPEYLPTEYLEYLPLYDNSAFLGAVA
jgi:hypothetical protein